MNAFLIRSRYPILIVITGLLWLLGLNYVLQFGLQHFIFPDSEDYALAAQELFVNHSVHCYRALLMSFVNGLPYFFGSDDAAIYQWSCIVNVGCWLGTALLLFEISKDFLSKKHAFLVVVGFFLLVGNFAINYHLLTESLYTFWISFGFYGLFRYHQSQKFQWLSIGLSFFLLSMLIKPGSKFLAVVFILFFIREIIRNYKLKSMAFMYVSVLLIAVQLFGMKAKFGDYKISYIDGVTYYNYLFAKAEAYKTGIDYHQVKNQRVNFVLSQSVQQQKAIALADLKNQLQYNTVNVFKAYLSNLIDNTKTGSDAIMKLDNMARTTAFDYSKAFFFTVSKWQNRMLTVIGFVLSVLFLYKRKTHKMFGLMGCFILYTVLLSGISCDQGDRFHLVAFPMILILMAKSMADVRVKV